MADLEVEKVLSATASLSLSQTQGQDNDESPGNETSNNDVTSKLIDDTFYLEEASIEADSDDDFQYVEVPLDDDLSLSGNEGDEDLETVVRAVQEKESIVAHTESPGVRGKVECKKRPEVVEDFVRNYLVHMNMMCTLDCFQTEWYELKEKGLLKEEDCNEVPDIYVRNRQLDELVNSLKLEVEKYKEAAQKAKETHLKLRKERDFHRMHHKRIVQEKEKLVSDIKTLRQHYESYEPALKALQHKYELAMKEKMLTKLERDRAIGQMEGMEAVNQYHLFTDAKGIISGNSPTKAFNVEGSKEPFLEETKNSDFPPDKGVNPLLSKNKVPCAHLNRAGGFRLTNTIKAHTLAVSGFALHPRKRILASVSDDKTWKLWSIPDGDMIMTGEGHTEWLSDCVFSPEGHRICTTSGDASVKIWDFVSEKCEASFTDHTHVVWGCSWHTCGDFIASCSMDCTSKIWDLNSQRCRNTLRGHSDSVNSIQFLPYSNTLCTCSADKTISLWDARTGLCAQTLHGHNHSINHVNFNLQGDSLVSGDAFGIVNLWDVRTISIVASVDLGPQPVNRVAFDPGSSVIAAASNNSEVRMYEIESGEVTSLSGHDDAVQTVMFDLNGEFLFSGSSDTMINIWS